MLYKQFCDLVVEHYRENRNVNFYAGLMGYDARYFSNICRYFKHATGIYPQEYKEKGKGVLEQV